MFYITINIKPSNVLACLLGSGLILSGFNLHANSPVKSVDAEGNVTYSDKPVAGAEQVTKISIQSNPSDSEVEAARLQAQKNIKAAEEIDASKEAKKEQQAAKRKASQKKTDTTPEVIINAPPIPPYYGTKPRPPIQNLPEQERPSGPGIKPPPIPSHPIARPRR